MGRRGALVGAVLSFRLCSAALCPIRDLAVPLGVGSGGQFRAFPGLGGGDLVERIRAGLVEWNVAGPALRELPG